MFLNKFVALSGLASRRQSVEYIKDGQIKVNGKVEKKPTYLVQSQDIVTFRGKQLKIEDHIYLLLNKPEGYLSSTFDPHHTKTVFNLIPEKFTKKYRLFPVGRLDINSSGMILLTNDGDLALKLTHPRYHLPKKYRLKVKGKVSKQKLSKFAEGIQLEEGITAPAEIKVVEYNQHQTELEVVLYEGKKRQIRRMAAELHWFVLGLKRVQIGKLKLGDLETGQWRQLNKTDLKLLR